MRMALRASPSNDEVVRFISLRNILKFRSYGHSFRSFLTQALIASCMEGNSPSHSKWLSS